MTGDVRDVSRRTRPTASRICENSYELATITIMWNDDNHPSVKINCCIFCWIKITLFAVTLKSGACIYHQQRISTEQKI